MRRTYEVKSGGYAIDARLVKMGVEHLNGAEVPQDMSTLDLATGEKFRASHPDLINRFDHLVAQGHLAVMTDEPEWEPPAPPAPPTEPEPVACDDAFTVMKSAVIDLGNTVIGYKSHDMAKFENASGSLSVLPGVKMKAGDCPTAAGILAVLEKEQIIAKE